VETLNIIQIVRNFPELETFYVNNNWFPE